MTISIREATESDAPAIYRLIQKLAEHVGSPNGAEQSLATLTEFIANKTLRAFLAIAADGEIVGHLSFYTAYSTWKGPFVMMEDLYVDPERRGQRIGQKLLVHLGKWAKENNFVRIKYECAEDDKETMRFYEKFNATKVDRLHFTEYQIIGEALDELAQKSF